MAICPRERSLDRRVPLGVFRVSPEVVPELDVVTVRLASLCDHVQMVVRLIGGLAERLSALDAEVPLVLVTDRLESLDGARDVGGRFDDNVDIYDGFRGQPRHSRAPDVINSHGQVADGFVHSPSKLLEELRPCRIVSLDDDGLGHTADPTRKDDNVLISPGGGVWRREPRMSTEHVLLAILPRFLLDGHREELMRVARGRALLVPDDDSEVVAGLPAALEIVVTGIDEAVFERVVEAPGLRWVHSISAGVEHLPLAGLAERGVLLTNSAGAYAPAMAEYALAAMIMLARSLPSWLEGQRERRWLEAGTFASSILRGKRLGVVGYGAVGRQLAAAAKALGMEVWATRRTPLFISGEPLDRLLPANDLHELLGASDFVALCASLNASTRHIIGGPELAVMKPTAVLVNVARGGLVDEEALVRALREGRLRAAMLDVTTEEPLPRDSALWTAPNLFITPHISGNTPESWNWEVEFFCRNLELYLDGSPERMGNLVDYSAML